MHPAEHTQAARLRRMKAVATGLLLAMLALFVTGFALQESYPAFAYLRAAAEGGTVGALADWFAVTALFRHPLGLKIPHTALIPRKKDQLGAMLADFVHTNFVAGDVAREKIDRLQVSAAAGAKAQELLADPQRRAQVLANARLLVSRGLDLSDDHAVRSLLATVAENHVVKPDWSPTLGRTLAELVAHGHHQKLVTLLAERAGLWVVNNPQMIEQVIAERAPGWAPAFANELLARKIHKELVGLATAITHDPQHSVRRDITAWLQDLSVRLHDDPQLRATVEGYKTELLSSPQLQEWASQAWSSVKRVALAELEKPDSELSLAIGQALDFVADQLSGNAELQRALDSVVSRLAGAVLRDYGPALTGVIEQTVQRWDGKQTSRTIELFVGRDLQFIRINGTVVGALAGLCIFTLAQLLINPV